jgi:hypothetical protein
MYSSVYQKNSLFIRSVGFTLKTKERYITCPIKSSWKGFNEKWFYIDLQEKSDIKGMVECQLPPRHGI